MQPVEASDESIRSRRPVQPWQVKTVQIDAMGAVEACAQQGIIIVEDSLRLGLLRSERTTVMNECQDIIFALPVASLKVEEFGIRISILQVTVPRPLPRDGPGQRCKAERGLLEVAAQLNLLR